jgi:hypothetical protein
VGAERLAARVVLGPAREAVEHAPGAPRTDCMLARATERIRSALLRSRGSERSAARALCCTFVCMLARRARVGLGRKGQQSKHST